MEARWSRLFIHACRTGQIDFRGFSPRDPYWAIKEGLILSDLEDEFVAELNRMTYFWHLSLGSASGWEEDTSERDNHRKDAINTWNDFGRYLLPWYKGFSSKKEKSLEQLWKEFKDQEKDPEYGAWLKEERKRLRDLHLSAKMEAEALSEASKRLRKLEEEQVERARLRRRRAQGFR